MPLATILAPALALVVVVAPVRARAQSSVDAPHARPRVHVPAGRPAEIVVPVPRVARRSWGSGRTPGVEGLLSVTWYSGRTQVVTHRGRHALPLREGVGWEWHVDSTTVAGDGDLGALVRAGRGAELLYRYCGEFGCYASYAMPAIAARAAGDSAIVVTLASSSLLDRMRQLRPDSVDVSLSLPPLQHVWRAERVPVTYGWPAP